MTSPHSGLSLQKETRNSEELREHKLSIGLWACEALTRLVGLEEEVLHLLEGVRLAIVCLEADVDDRVVEVLERHRARHVVVVRPIERLGVGEEDGRDLRVARVQRVVHLGVRVRVRVNGEGDG